MMTNSEKVLSLMELGQGQCHLLLSLLALQVHRDTGISLSVPFEFIPLCLGTLFKLLRLAHSFFCIPILLYIHLANF